MIIYWSWPIPAQFDGYCFGPISFIRPEKRGDLGLAAHENTHTKQWWKAPILWNLLYTYSAKHRQAYEVEAYRAELAIDTGSQLLFANDLATRYGLNVTVAEALVLLS